MARIARRVAAVVIGAALVFGCDDSTEPEDASVSMLDAGPRDAGGRDGGEGDAGRGGSDAGGAADAGGDPDAGPPPRAPGGFLEMASDVGDIGRVAFDSTVASLPAAGGRFTFPAPYGTEAVRLTDAITCGGADCVNYVGYSYWRNINDHVGADHLLLVLGLDEGDGGSGLTLFRVNKTTLAVEDLGPVLEGTGLPTNVSGEGVYFSATLPHALYVRDGPRLVRVDVMTKETEVLFDVEPEYGAGHYIWQHHTSDDDRVHSFSLRDASYANVGCAVYFEDTESFQLYEPTGDFDECQVDRSGGWLVIKEDVDGADGEDNRIIDLSDGSERVLLDRDGAAGHSDLGHGYMIAADNWNDEPGAQRVWDFSMALDAAGNGTLAYYDTAWSDNAGDHVSHTNAVAGAPLDRQVACHSRLFRTDATNPRSGEIVCYRLDGSLEVLVVAPTLSVANGGDNYSVMPKGNLDVTGRWFIWTANLGGDRLDAFLVRVPIEALLDP